MLEAYPLKRRPYWGLNLDLETEAEAVSEIPGITIDTLNSRAEGLVDAVAAVCALLGRPLPKSIVSDFQQPSFTEFPLHAYQQEGLRRLNAIVQQTGSALLADDMGLGKTRQAIAFAKERSGRVFVVCPAFVRESWRAELQRLGENSSAILGPGKTKAEIQEWETSSTARWVVTSYHHGMIQRAYETAFPKSSPAIFIMDEAHRLRGRDAKRFKIAKEISVLAQARLMLTGTPMWSRPRDFYALLSILFGNRFGNQYAFDRRYCNGLVNDHGGWVNKGATQTDELKLRLSYYMIRRERKDVAHELPSLTRQVIWCDEDKKATVAFHRAILTKSPAATHEALLATHEAKIEAALHLASEAQRFLLLTYRKSHAHSMAMRLNEDGVGCVCLTGDIPTKQRQALVNQAREQGIGIVATIDSVFEGVDGIQEVAHVGIMHALDYTPLKMAQAEARLHRLRQTDPVIWYYLACRESMDSLVINTVVSKMDMNRSLLGQHVNRDLRDALSDSAGNEGEGEANALRALYESL